MFFHSSLKVTTMLSDGLLHDFGPSSMVVSAVNGTNAASLAVRDQLYQHTGVTTSQIPVCKDSHHGKKTTSIFVWMIYPEHLVTRLDLIV